MTKQTSWTAATLICLNKDTLSKISLLAKINNHTIAHTISFLVCIAFKHNYTADLRYIPCVPVSDPAPITSQTHSRQPCNFTIQVVFSKTNLSKLNKLMKLYSYSSLSETARSLIETVFLYDYDHNLFFHTPIPLNQAQRHSNSSQPNSSHADHILLDII
jgi:hypothetical protein